MSKGVLGLALGMLLVGAVSVWASRTGFGIPQPERQPPSIREGSERMSSPGHHRTRYFVGGGVFRGK